MYSGYIFQIAYNKNPSFKFGETPHKAINWEFGTQPGKKKVQILNQKKPKTSEPASPDHISACQSPREQFGQDMLDYIK